MALINLSDWIDRYGDEADGADESDLARQTFWTEREAVAPCCDYRINAVLPIGSEIADTRTRRL